MNNTTVVMVVWILLAIFLPWVTSGVFAHLFIDYHENEKWTKDLTDKFFSQLVMFLLGSLSLFFVLSWFVSWSTGVSLDFGEPVLKIFPIIIDGYLSFALMFAWWRCCDSKKWIGLRFNYKLFFDCKSNK